MTPTGALAPHLYTDTAWFARERERLAQRTWQVFGLTDDLAADGDWRRNRILGAIGRYPRRGSGIALPGLARDA